MGQALWTVCVWCAQIHTQLLNCLEPHWPTNTNTFNPFGRARCGEVTAADTCVLWFEENPNLVWLQTVLLAEDSSLMGTSEQWAAAHERNLIECCTAPFQMSLQVLIITKIIPLQAMITHEIFSEGGPQRWVDIQMTADNRSFYSYGLTSVSRAQVISSDQWNIFSAAGQLLPGCSLSRCHILDF